MFESAQEVFLKAEFWKLLMVFGGIVMLFHLILLLYAIFEIKKSSPRLYKAVVALEGMATGCGLVAVPGFIQGMWFVGVIAAALVLIFYCGYRKFNRLYYDGSAKQKAQILTDAHLVQPEQQGGEEHLEQ